MIHRPRIYLDQFFTVYAVEKVGEKGLSKLQLRTAAESTIVLIEADMVKLGVSSGSVVRIRGLLSIFLGCAILEPEHIILSKKSAVIYGCILSSSSKQTRSEAFVGDYFYEIEDGMNMFSASSNTCFAVGLSGFFLITFHGDHCVPVISELN